MNMTSKEQVVTPPNKRTRARLDFPPTFLPARIAQAADTAMDEVLAEDELLRAYGIGRTR